MSYTITWRDSTGEHTEKRDTWRDAVGIQAAHHTHNARLDIADPTVTTCAHCGGTITQTTIPWRWDNHTGDDLCRIAGILRHEPIQGWM